VVERAKRMTSPPSKWPRSSWRAGGSPNVFQLFCFSSGPLTDVPFSAARFGLPDPELMKCVEVRELSRALDPQWFDGFRSGALRQVATQALGDVSGLDAATQLTAVLIAREDQSDLAHVQAGWAVAHWLVHRGVSVVLDAQTNRFWKGEDVVEWPVQRPFALSTDVNLVVEADPHAPIATLHTRGMQKFGRPDVVVLGVPGARWDAVGALLRSLAARLADGEVVRPGDVVTLGEERAAAHRFDPAVHGELHLNNEALLLEAAG
jgi:hypothetical protein